MYSYEAWNAIAIVLAARPDFVVPESSLHSTVKGNSSYRPKSILHVASTNRLLIATEIMFVVEAACML